MIQLFAAVKSLSYETLPNYSQNIVRVCQLMITNWSRLGFSLKLKSISPKYCITHTIELECLLNCYYNIIGIHLSFVHRLTSKNLV